MRPAARRTTPMGVPGAYISDLLLQTFGLAIVLVPVALITWGVRMVRTHHLGFFGLRLSLLLLALLMMSVACVGLGDVGAAATHAGPGGLVGPGPGRPLPRAGADPFERRQPRPDRAGLRRPRLHRHGAGARHEPHRPAADLPHPARALPGWRVAGAGGDQPVARQAAVARRGSRHAGAADRLCRDPGRDRRQPVRSSAFPAPLRADPRRRRTLAGARFADGRRALCADRTAGRRDP